MALQLPPGADLSKIPAGMPPEGSGLIPNFIDPPSLSSTTLGVSITLMAIGVAFAATSIYEHRKNFKVADYLLLISVVFGVAYTGLVFSYADMQRHQWDVPLLHIMSPVLLKKQFAQSILIAPAIFFPKAAILFVYFQIFRVNQKLRLGVYAALLLDVLAYLPQFVVQPIFCAPHVGEPWTIQVSMRCGKSTYWGIVQSVLGLILDLALFFMPIPIVVKLSMSTQRKLAVSTVFGTAVLGIVASVISMIYRIRLLNSTDATWFSAIVELCVLVEIWIAIIVGSMPGFASRFKLLVIESNVFSSLRSRLLSFVRTGGTSQKSSRNQGYSGYPKSNEPTDHSESYVRLHDDNADQVELGNMSAQKSERKVPKDRIAKTVTINQQSERSDSPRM